MNAQKISVSLTEFFVSVKVFDSSVKNKKQSI